MLTEQRYINAMCCNATASCEYLQSILTAEQNAGLKAVLCPPPTADIVAVRVGELRAAVADALASGLITPEGLVAEATALAESIKEGGGS
jgi:hypothetical protein